MSRSTMSKPAPSAPRSSSASLPLAASRAAISSEARCRLSTFRLTALSSTTRATAAPGLTGPSSAQARLGERRKRRFPRRPGELDVLRERVRARLAPGSLDVATDPREAHRPEARARRLERVRGPDDRGRVTCRCGGEQNGQARLALLDVGLDQLAHERLVVAGRGTQLLEHGLVEHRRAVEAHLPLRPAATGAFAGAGERPLVRRLFAGFDLADGAR